MTGLLLASCDLAALKRRVSALAEDRPGVYRMIGPDGRVIYVGKSKSLRTRLMSYFRARFPEDKAARIIHATADLDWRYQPSDFAAHLEELRLIKQHSPLFNVRMNRARNVVFIKIIDAAAPKLLVGRSPGASNTLHYGPFHSPSRTREAVRVLNDMLGLRDCSLEMPMTYPEQGDLFGQARAARCIRYELGTCSGPCAGLVSESDYRERIFQAIEFLEGRSVAPMDRVVAAMDEASNASEFEAATLWRSRFETLEWLLTSISRARTAIDALTFVYHQPGSHGEDLSYIIKRATVRAVATTPHTPIEEEAFRALVAEHADSEPAIGPIPVEQIDETLLLLGWFRRHPTAMRRTDALEEWLPDSGTRVA